MTFDQLANYLEKVEQTDARLKMTQQLAKLLLKLDETEIKPTLYLLQGRLAPLYQSLEFNLSEKMVLRALARLTTLHQTQTQVQTTDLFGRVDETGVLSQIQLEYKQLGDLGLLAEKTLQRLKTSLGELSILEVYQKLKEIAQTSGVGSQEKKLELLTKLLSQVSPLSGRYIIRIVLGKMRLGFGLMTLLDALSWAKVGDKTQSKLLESYYQRQADIGKLAQIYLKDGLVGLQSAYDVQVGVPVVPELCQRLNTAKEIIQKMGQVIAEPKYDGMRAQLHFNKKKQLAKVFSRSLEDLTHMFPEVKEALAFVKFESCILDAEAVGVDPTTGQIVPFQETMKRKRKYNVTELAKQLPVRFYVFDILDVNNKPLIDEPLLKRKEFLNQAFKPNNILIKTLFELIDDPVELHRFHQQMLAEGYEGVVVKHPQAKYRAGRKGWRWVKIKEAEGKTGKLNDTLDLVVMGYYLGKGKRAQFGLGAILVGVMGYNEEVLSIAKIGTGMTEDQLIELKERLDKLRTDKKPKEYHPVNKALTPDVWVEPGLVVEVAADEITQSPVHAAKVALRFPRLVRLRTDKSWEDITNINELQSISS